MALKLIWSPTANRSLEKTIYYLQEEWTFREILKLEKNIEEVLMIISQNPKTFTKSQIKSQYRKALCRQEQLSYL